MCGFVGEFIVSGEKPANLELAQKQAQRLVHRGPDEAGSFASADGRCAIGFRRLSIIDLPLSHQPMTRQLPQGQVTLAFNGEIYNFRALREELGACGESFATHGDTEVLLAMYLRHGLVAMLGRLEGMFAAAIYDGRAGKLHLMRDRLGVKPLWYARAGGRIVFASEAKALLGYEGVDRQVDPQAVLSYLTLGYVPAPRSIWRGVQKLPPASSLTLPGENEPQRWWAPPCRVRPISQAEAVEQVRQVVREAVSQRLVADVPIGALLSGGVDSSIVTALMCQASGDPRAVKTFSAGFAESAFDERPFGRQVAQFLGTEHRELLVEADAAALVDKLVAQYDEPLGDSSALPTYLLCQAIRPHVTVALAGDGGDEAFGGYDRHRAMWLGQHMSSAKAMLVTAAAMIVDSFAPKDEKSPLRRFVRFARGLDAPPALRYLGYRALFTLEQLDALMTDEFAEQVVPTAPRDAFAELYESGECDTELSAAQRHDVLDYLPNDLLVKADIASMAHGLELRSPFLDHRVIELGLSLPDELKVSRRRGKRILAAAFGELLPAEVFSRPKAGFGVPLGDWLAGPLLPMLRETLLDQSFIDVGWLKRSKLEHLIDSHAAGKADHRHRLWALLWLGRWKAICDF
jgi:asparagine synthase (glutamine-hydrolysing)